MQQPPGYPPGPPIGGAGGYPPPQPPYPPQQQYPYGPPPTGSGGGAPPPAKKGMSAAAIVLIILATIMALGGGTCVACLCVINRSGEEAREKDNVDRARSTKVRIDDVLSAYKTNEVRADNAYKGKYITASGGQVEEVRKDFSDNMYVNVGTGKVFEIPVVHCLLRSDQTNRAKSLGRGSRVTVRGRVKGLTIHVVLEDCEIL